jgi:hypothetical protein
MGRALTIMLAERGCHVACCDVDMDQLALTVQNARGLGLGCRVREKGEAGSTE